MVFMRIVKGMSSREIQDQFPEESLENIDQQVSRGARELGIDLKKLS
jgi:hypothetical protein